MKIQRNKLSAAVKVAGKATDRKSSMPILGTVRLSAKDGLLTVTGTDLCSVVETSVECSGDLAAVCVAPKDLASLLDGIAVKSKGRAPDADVDLSLDGISLVVAGPLATIRIGTFAGTDFPSVPTVAPIVFQIYDRVKLNDALDFILPAVSQDETRYHLNGAFFCGSEIVATDGHRLHKIGGMPVVAMKASDGDEDKADAYDGVILPRAGLKILSSLIGKGGEIVAMTVDAHNAMFLVDAVKLTVKRVDAQFPPFRQVIPREQGTTLTGDAATLRAAFAASMSMASDRTCGVKAQITPFGSALRTDNPDKGSAEYPLPAVMVNADPSVDLNGYCKPLEIGFNARYWTEFLACMTGPVSISFGEALDPGKIEQGDKLAVVMPCRI